MFQRLLLITLIYTIYAQEVQYPFTITRTTFLTTDDLLHNYHIGDLCLGKPQRCFKMAFSIRTYFIWLCQKQTLDRLYDKEQSTSYIESNTRQGCDAEDNSVVGMVANESFDINNITNPKMMSFVLTNERNCVNKTIEGEVGLNSFDILHYSSKGFSLLEQVNASTNVKYNNAIGIRYHTNNTGIITFGVDNDEITNNLFYQFNMSGSSAKYFNPSLDYIAYGNEKVMTNTFVYYHLETKVTVLPSIIYEGFRDQIAPLLFLNDSCTEIQDDPDFFYFLCNKDIDTSHFWPLNFSFANEQTYLFNMKNQFMEFGENDKWLFGLIGTKRINNQIEIGQLFFRDFYIILERTNHTLSLIPIPKKVNLISNTESEGKNIKVNIVLLKAIQITFIVFAIFMSGYIMIVIRNKKRSKGQLLLG